MCPPGPIHNDTLILMLVKKGMGSEPNWRLRQIGRSIEFPVQSPKSVASLSISVDAVIDGRDSISRPYQRAGIGRIHLLLLPAWPA